MHVPYGYIQDWYGNTYIWLLLTCSYYTILRICKEASNRSLREIMPCFQAAPWISHFCVMPRWGVPNFHSSLYHHQLSPPTAMPHPHGIPEIWSPRRASFGGVGSKKTSFVLERRVHASEAYSQFANSRWHAKLLHGVGWHCACRANTSSPPRPPLRVDGVMPHHKRSQNNNKKSLAALSAQTQAPAARTGRVSSEWKTLLIMAGWGSGWAVLPVLLLAFHPMVARPKFSFHLWLHIKTSQLFYLSALSYLWSSRERAAVFNQAKCQTRYE